ncbi:MAG: type II toxin-antitoxin system PemK/MazF family toxin [Thermodesulfovibrionales bacterium]|nr:type II toxin-antitoxin system PemK/MazF family toxin [Thermodesulfovibrionales bacterium]
MTFGDIYLVEIPTSGGHEQQGVRPAIVVQTAENIEKVPTVLIVPFTTQIRAANFPFTFVVEPDSTNNLTSTSIALVFQLRAIDKKRIKSKIGSLNPADMQILKQKLENILKV